MERMDGLGIIHRPLPPPTLARGRTALVIIDMQYLDAHPDYGDGRAAKEKGIVCGVRTQSCVETTVRDAADRGYDVILVPQGCAAIRQEFHERALEVLAGIFCHVWDAERALEALAALR